MWIEVSTTDYYSNLFSLGWSTIKSFKNGSCHHSCSLSHSKVIVPEFLANFPLEREKWTEIPDWSLNSVWKRWHKYYFCFVLRIAYWNKRIHLILLSSCECKKNYVQRKILLAWSCAYYIYIEKVTIYFNATGFKFYFLLTTTDLKINSASLTNKEGTCMKSQTSFI